MSPRRPGRIFWWWDDAVRHARFMATNTGYRYHVYAWPQSDGVPGWAVTEGRPQA